MSLRLGSKHTCPLHPVGRGLGLAHRAGASMGLANLAGGKGFFGQEATDSVFFGGLGKADDLNQFERFG